MIRWLTYVLKFFMRDYATVLGINAVKRRGLAAYFRAVNGIRRMLIFGIVLSVLLNVMTLSFFGLVASASWLFIEDAHLRLYVLLGVFSVTFVVPLVGGCYLLSERFWLRLSGAQGLVENDSRG